jgi:NAD(P)-dependent dehydrogenase (short-subunit alcohol dehydrogenase family)
MNKLNRLVQPDEVAEVSMWLASDAASAITGQDINVTGG